MGTLFTTGNHDLARVRKLTRQVWPSISPPSFQYAREEPRAAVQDLIPAA